MASADLPKGGTVVAHPTEKKTFYYLTKGLYISTDEKRSWRMIQGDFEFQSLFVHPRTGALYAVIGCVFYRTNDKGFLTASLGSKAVKSEDGSDWTDITADASGYQLMNFFVDPDHPERVCMEANSSAPISFSPRTTNIPHGPSFGPGSG